VSNNQNTPQRVVIAGGGTAGWIAAVALSKKLGSLLNITLVESKQMGTIGVGEATIPTARTFHKLLGIDESALMKATEATFKLGISFEDWGKKGDRYIHSFGQTGKESWLSEFQHYWLHGKAQGFSSDFGDYCLELQAAKQGKFATSDKSPINYAYHLDALLYAKFLRSIAIEHGVVHTEGTISKVNQNASTGNIESLTLESGTTIEGDLFIDCTGFEALLIEQTLETGFEDWSHLLPCDSAVAVQTDVTGTPLPMTRSVALDAGWRWCIPLQNRMGNGYVYSSRHISDDEATASLLREVEGNPINDPRVIKHRPGIRRKVWNKNCVAIGLSAGFLEPLESTGIHLFMMGITRLMQLFPFNGVDQSLQDQYNTLAVGELTSIRDFILLHYHATQRDDSSFWRRCKNMDIPDTLAHRIALFQKNGHAYQAAGELFRVDSWTQVMLGQGIEPEHYHHLAKTMGDDQLAIYLNSMKDAIGMTVEKLPSHQTFIDQYCKAAVI